MERVFKKLRCWSEALVASSVSAHTLQPNVNGTSQKSYKTKSKSRFDVCKGLGVVHVCIKLVRLHA